ncbi:carbamoyl-phosphate synthase large subunit [Agrococcus baldri]|uniref:Carbamoyl-phosphate synthase large subunit n=1 Tax=Agrococcus baldri TaxID=153730 RepID=A0AA94HKI3_9MICO|nr:ATP-grasp domain-containing protein [Agrococcus baldri]SFS00272.1 carbamoyl-phosphate synthase large subunit [Agrococcus baldri]
MTPALTVLFTSVGRRVELIRHFLDHASANPGDLRVLGTEIDRFSPAAQLLGDAALGVPRTEDPSYDRVIADICSENNVDVIFPLIDPDILRLGTTETSAPLASVDPESARMVSDKWLTYRWLVDRDIPTAISWLPSELVDTGYPLFMKPRRGSGGIDAFKIHSTVELDFFTTYIDDPIVQELLEGPEITVDVIVGARSEILAMVQRQRLAVRGGEVSRGAVVEDPAVSALVYQVIEGLKPTGPVTVQGMYARDKSFRITEINARMGGGIPLAVAAGVPVARLLTDSWLGRERTEETAIDVGLHMVRFDESLFYKP